MKHPLEVSTTHAGRTCHWPLLYDREHHVVAVEFSVDVLRELDVACFAAHLALLPAAIDAASSEDLRPATFN